MNACHCVCKLSSEEIEDPTDAKGKHYEDCGQHTICGCPYPPRLKACCNCLSQEIEDPSPDPESVPVTLSPEPKMIPAPHFMCSSSSRQCGLEAFMERLITAGPPKAFFDNHWDERFLESW